MADDMVRANMVQTDSHGALVGPRKGGGFKRVMVPVTFAEYAKLTELAATSVETVPGGNAACRSLLARIDAVRKGE